jgi:hypothetical protein
VRGKLVLITVPVCAIAIVTSATVAAASGTEHTGDAKLDKLHAVRRNAASPLPADPATLSGGAPSAWQVAVDAAAAQARIQQYLDAVAAAAASTPAPSSPPVEPAPAPERSGGDFLACVRQRESGGDYSIHNYGGSGAAGAYQFLPSTWDSIAAASGRPDLVGIDPAAASAADQDAMAQALYAQQGAAPWGGGC